MTDYIEITAEQWLKQNELSDAVISHPHAGDQYVQTVSDALKQFAIVVMEQTIESCSAHSDGDIDFDGVWVNVCRQFKLQLPDYKK